MPSIKPTPRTWTLLFKINKTTILLHVDPLQKMHLIRAELLKALQATHAGGKLPITTEDPTAVQHHIPDNPDDLVFAKPVDINDLTAGWEPLEKDDGLGFDDVEGGKGKGKAKSLGQGAAKSKSSATDCPQGAGLRDGGVLAVRFRSEKEKDKGRARADEDLDVDEIAKEGLDEDQAVWDVKIASYDDTYGEEDAAAAAAGEIPLGMSASARGERGA